MNTPHKADTYFLHQLSFGFELCLGSAPDQLGYLHKRIVAVCESMANITLS